MNAAAPVAQQHDEQQTERLIPRALTLSITAHSGLTWEELWSELHPQWDAVQRAANEVLRAYLIEDSAEIDCDVSGKRRLRELPKTASRVAYAAARRVAPELTAGCASDIAQRVRQLYLKHRWAVRVSGRQSGASFERPLPLSIRRQDWQLVLLGLDEKGRQQYGARFALGQLMGYDRPLVRFVIRTRFEARLLHKIVNREYQRATLEILPPGWKRNGPIRAKIVYRRPPRQKSPAGGTLRLRTATAHLLIATDGEQVWHWSYDWLRGRILSYERRRQRHAEDCKHERRVPASRRRVWRVDSGLAAGKHHARVRTAILNIARQAVGLAQRRGAGLILLDDREHGYCDPFPWAQLRQCIAQCAEREGLEFQLLKEENTP